MIESFHFGKIIIDGIAYQDDVIIFPDRVMSNWWREKGHSLSLRDLQEVIAEKPDKLIIGTGVFGRMQVPPDTFAYLKKTGIEVITQKTEQACEHYNQQKHNNNVIAALHLTC